MASSADIQAPVSGANVTLLKNWTSLWADLLHVDMVLHARDGVPDEASNLFLRRALWEGAVIAYGRTAKNGRRQVLVKELLGLLGRDAERIHDEVVRWRDKHIAHRVDAQHETVTAEAVIDASRARITGVEVRVSPALGPEDGGALVPTFQAHIKALRDATWEQRMRPLETLVIEDHAESIDELLATAAPASPSSREFSISVRPSDPR